MQKVELLAPAGDLNRLKVALLYGADAVYIGGKDFSLRARSSNFTVEDIAKAVKEAKKYNAKIYVTCNIIAHNENLIESARLKEYIKKLDKIGVTGLIVADLAIANIIKEVSKNLEIHISTQLSTINSETVKFLEDYGVDRIVLSRECSLKNIKEIKEKTNVELEVFIHGGMCMAISGKCLLSNYFTSRDANRGGCAHSCRWYYNIYDENKKKLSKNKFTFASKDLQAVDYIKSLMEIGVTSLKIEGRMKGEHYLGTIVGTYRRIIDDIYNNKKVNSKKYLKEMAKAENRPTCTGYLGGKFNEKQQIFDRKSEIPSQEFVAKVLSYNKKSKIATIEQRNYFTTKQKFEVFGPHKMAAPIKIKKIWDKDNENINIARHAKKVLYFKTDLELEPYDMIRVKK